VPVPVPVPAGWLAEMRQPAAPFTGPVPDSGRISWVRPELIVEVEYRQFTGRLRHAALKRVADGVDPTGFRLPATR
jgi:bifunctional non-homologous end joining protein LigD